MVKWKKQPDTESQRNIWSYSNGTVTFLVYQFRTHNTWILYCYQLGIKDQELNSVTIKEAKTEAVNVVRAKIAKIASYAVSFEN